MSIAGGDGTDTLEVNGSATIDLSVTLDQSSGDTAVVTGFENVDASGSSVAVTLTGDDNANVLTGGDGDDTLTGGLGADTVTVAPATTRSTTRSATGRTRSTAGRTPPAIRLWCSGRLATTRST